MATLIRVRIVGAAGSMGRELARLLWNHPHVDLVEGTSRGDAGSTLRNLDPSTPPLPLTHPDHVDPSDVDLNFLCLPHGASAAMAKTCLDAGSHVIDLSGDLRLKDEDLHLQTYGSERDPDVASQAVYGLTEFVRDQLPNARLVSNPGCYPTTVALGLAPLARNGHLHGDVLVTSLSGVSGAGVTPNPTTHFCSAADDVRPYKVGRVHRHIPEMEQTLRWLSNDAHSPRVLFTPHLVPLQRGLLSTITVDAPDLDPQALHDLYTSTYADAPLVNVLPLNEPARIRAVAHSHHTAIGITPCPDMNRLVITSAIDNLVKGGSGQAVQNMNLVFNFPELLALPGFPT